MISIKRYMEQLTDPSVRVLQEAYPALLVAVAESGRRVCPPVGQSLEQELISLAKTVLAPPEPSAVKLAHERVLRQVQRWGVEAEDYFKQKANEVKELLLSVTGVVEHFGKRNGKYKKKFGKVSADLLDIATLEDVSSIRASLLACAAELRSCMEEMLREDNERVALLQASLADYQGRLDRAEQLASRDPLTGLLNRRAVESRIQRRIEARSPFCTVVVDLNRFKQVNDKYGHLAGDELLRRIAAEIKASSRSDDIVGRWGGDEFVIVLDCPYMSAKMQVQRLRKWALGEYEIEAGEHKIKLCASASFGIAEWRYGESMLQVLSRADADMYREKEVRTR